LIYETVTKGLDKNAEMKDSGVEWIGEIPSHWKPIRLKDIVKSKITSGSTPNEHLILLEDDLKSNFVNFYKIENVNKNGKISKKYIISDDTNSGMTRSKLKENDILFTIAGTIGTVAIITSNDLPANVNQAIAIIRVKDKINHDFVKYFLTLLKGNNSARGGVIKNINLTTLSNLTISLPLTTEQNEIADYLNLETLKIEKQIELINKKVELLKEYKQSLIYEAVTGKLEIE
jgi:type I restriction enzyme S subunit